MMPPDRQTFLSFAVFILILSNDQNHSRIIAQLCNNIKPGSLDQRGFHPIVQLIGRHSEGDISFLGRMARLGIFAFHASQ